MFLLSFFVDEIPCLFVQFIILRKFIFESFLRVEKSLFQIIKHILFFLLPLSFKPVKLHLHFKTLQKVCQNFHYLPLSTSMQHRTVTSVGHSTKLDYLSEILVNFYHSSSFDLLQHPCANYSLEHIELRSPFRCISHHSSASSNSWLPCFHLFLTASTIC